MPAKKQLVQPITASEFEILRTDLAALRADIDRRFVQVETKLDAKPSIATPYSAVTVLMFGIGAVITSTVVVLSNLGLLHK